ncbi:hypothetical protein C8R42DRAFT_690914 [Lentinula raphanica]|nr:hypothetical protein C8R42DRAFT_690914 [Lentinula raphanica]
MIRSTYNIQIHHTLLLLWCFCSSTLFLSPLSATAAPVSLQELNQNRGPGNQTTPPFPDPNTASGHSSGDISVISRRAPSSSSGSKTTTLFYLTCLSDVEPIKKDGLGKHAVHSLNWLSYDPVTYLSMQMEDEYLDEQETCPNGEFAVVKFSLLSDDIKIMNLQNAVTPRFVSDITKVQDGKAKRTDPNVAGTTKILKTYDVIIALSANKHRFGLTALLTEKSMEPSVLKYVGSSSGKTVKEAWEAMSKGNVKA